MALYIRLKRSSSQSSFITYDPKHIDKLLDYQDYDVSFVKVGELKDPSVVLYNCAGWENTDPGDFRRIQIKLSKNNAIEFVEGGPWIKVKEIYRATF
ncbi:MAG: hypothetical protein MI674_07725 [Cytophagales bacterium]|nr:hypothetical protein [Cytophagales bacterium]